MRHWFETDWTKLFVPEMSLPELLLRATLIYLSLCLMLRVVLRRQAGRIALSDLLVVSLVAGVCRNPLIRDAYSITDGILVVALVLGLGYALDWLCFHVGFIHGLLHSPPLPLVENGRVLHENLRQELMTESQLHSKLRREGVSSPTEVTRAVMEGDGQVTVVKKGDHSHLNPVNIPASLEDLRLMMEWHERQASEINKILETYGSQNGTTHVKNE